MKLLYPLGFIALMSIGVLILIYIIKPNYQQKFISSTFVWKRSLKYVKKKLPVSKLRNILLIICQILILTLLSVVFTQPAEITKAETKEREVIAIIDSSASMRAETMGESRFERAVSKAREMADNVLSENGIVSVIVADSTPEYAANRFRSDAGDSLDDVLFDLIDNDACSYGSSDMDAALELSDEILLLNPNAEIFIYSDEEFLNIPDGVTVVNVDLDEEWNVAILDASAKKQDNYYEFTVDMACYGRDENVTLFIKVYGANASDSESEGITIPLSQDVECENDLTKRIIFTRDKIGVDDENTLYVSLTHDIYSFQSISVYVEAEDSFDQDNQFDIYSGQKEVLKVQYASPSELIQSFFPGAIYVLQSLYSDRYDIQFKEVQNGNYAVEGFDLYIFEHEMPYELPTDGIVMLVNPTSAPAGAGFTLESIRDFNKVNVPLTAEDKHPIMNNIDSKYITVSRYMRLTRIEPAYKTLMSCEGYPVLMVKNEVSSKVVVLPFSMNYSNLSVLPEFSLLMGNIINYYMPSMVSGNAFEVEESVVLNSRGQSLDVDGGGQRFSFNIFPATMILDLPGTYVLSQKTDFGKTITESIFVRIPQSESNIFGQREQIEDPYSAGKNEEFYKDALFYFALALVILLFVEWWLQGRENM